MAVEVLHGSALAKALNDAILPKLVEVGWGSGGSDDQNLAEYVVLMLVNGKKEDEIARELSGELLNLGPDDPTAQGFARWLFEEIAAQDARISGTQQTQTGLLPGDGENEDTAMDVNVDSISDIKAPTGPRSMRNGNNNRGGRERRMFGGPVSKAMERGNDSVLHRVRQTGSERINTHTRGTPAGPRGGMMRQGRNMNGRANNIQNGMAAMVPGMGGPPNGMPGPGPWMMPGQQPPSPIELYAMLEQQTRMMQQISQQMMAGGVNPNFPQNRPGKSLFDRVQDPRKNNNNFRRGGGPHQHQPLSQRQGQDGAGEDHPPAEGEDVDMSAAPKPEASNPEDTVCKYNLKCTNKECKFGHQSPAAPPGTHVDNSDVCTFGVACKNWKCVGRHPSPATKIAHQSEQDCKFFPNCQNPRCPFRHVPICRNGADCATPNCKFTHVKTKCRFNPCLNRSCAFVHEPGQQGGYKDKVWTADEKSHVSERQFVDSLAETEMVAPTAEGLHNDHEVQITT